MRGTVTMRQENSISALKCIIGTLYQYFRIYFFITLCWTNIYYKYCP